MLLISYCDSIRHDIWVDMSHPLNSHFLYPLFICIPWSYRTCRYKSKVQALVQCISFPAILWKMLSYIMAVLDIDNTFTHIYTGVRARARASSFRFLFFTLSFSLFPFLLLSLILYIISSFFIIVIFQSYVTVLLYKNASKCTKKEIIYITLYRNFLNSLKYIFFSFWHIVDHKSSKMGQKLKENNFAIYGEIYLPLHI